MNPKLMFQTCQKLRRGSLVQLHDEEQQTAFARVLGGEAVVVAFNNDTKPASLAFGVGDIWPGAARLRERLGTIKSEVLTTNGVLALSLPPRSAVVLTLPPGRGLQHVLSRG